MSSALAKYPSVLAIAMMASLVAGCSESPVDTLYDASKCGAVAEMLGQLTESQIAKANAKSIGAKIKSEDKIRINLELVERLRKDLGPIDNEGPMVQMVMLQDLYVSSRCQQMYRPLEASVTSTGIPELVSGVAPSTTGAAGSSDAQIDQTVDGEPASQADSPGDVVVDPPILGSAANETTGDITRPTQVFRQEDMIYLRVPYRGTRSAEHTLSTKWTFNGESGDVPVHEASKLIHADGNLAALFYMENRNTRAPGRYTVEVQVDGQTMRAVSFTVAEPMQLGSGVNQEDTVTLERPRPVPRCPPAVSDLERAMCRDPGLATLDKTLSELHRQAQATTNDVWELDQEQGKWRRDRRDPCREDIACLTAAYQERIDALSP